MELPPYRIPTLRSASRHMWMKAKEYLRKMGGIILWASIIVWFLSYFPHTNDKIEQYETQLQQVVEQQQEFDKQEQTSEFQMAENDETMFLDSLNTIEKQLKYKIGQEQQYSSYLGHMGRFIEPVLRPIGFDWKISVSLLSGVIAKEIVVSTMGVLYAGDDEESLREALQNQTYSEGEQAGQKIYSKPTTLALLVFVLIYIPCIAVIAAIRKETGKWKWALFNITYATTLAWILSYFVSKVAGLFF
jgi:ferrous iron transport protein B